MSKDPKPYSVSVPTPQDFREMDFYAWELMETFPSETAEELMERMISKFGADRVEAHMEFGRSHCSHIL